jgi:NADPH:quinone reductase-like Zn-dependent oxidoreductase
MSTSAPLENEDAASLQASAMRVHAFGGPEAMKLETVTLSPPGEEEILVRVRAAGVGPWDAWVRGGKSVLPQPLPLTPGSDVAGVVEQLGPGVTGFTIGEEVYGSTNPRFTDGYATRAICSAVMMARKPGSLSFVEAAGVPVVACTAWQMLFEHAKVEAGQSVLVLGGGGSVGSLAVQMAKRAGARVIASGREADAPFLASLGADVAIGSLDNPATILPDGIDAVIDLVGGESQLRAMDALEPGGILISAVSQPEAAVAEERGIEARFMLVRVNTQDLTRIAIEFDQGALKTRVGTTLPLDQAVTAHEMLEGRAAHAPGKIVLVVD